MSFPNRLNNERLQNKLNRNKNININKHKFNKSLNNLLQIKYLMKMI